MNRLGDTRRSCGLPASQEDGLARDRLAGCSAGELPIFGLVAPPVDPEQFQQLRWQQRLPVFAPFASTNPDRVPTAVNVTHHELGYFRYTKGKFSEFSWVGAELNLCAKDETVVGQ